MEFREGFKPSTFAFVARCSVQLSYRNWSGDRESNPNDYLGKVTGYHYITPA